MNGAFGLRRLLRGGLFLNDDVFLDLRDAEDGVAHALRFVFTLGLIIGFVVAAVAFAKDVTTDPVTQVKGARTTVDNVVARLEESGIQLFGDEEARALFNRYLDSGFKVAEAVVDKIVTTTPAPRPVVVLLESLGKWLSYPFGWLGMWLLWGVVTLLFARMIGGTATVQQMLATTSLVVAPHILDSLSFVPCGGLALQVLAFFWGLAVFVKGTAVANRFGIGPALVAVLAPLLVICGVIAACVTVVIALIVAANH